jgi:hypothetical protein
MSNNKTTSSLGINTNNKTTMGDNVTGNDIIDIVRVTDGNTITATTNMRRTRLSTKSST